ncbi:MAG: hypothetical protein ABMA13_12055, partial [Chthoniobacteraceae bacterium]
MPLNRICTTCAAPLPDDAPDGAICESCAEARETEQDLAPHGATEDRAPSFVVTTSSVTPRAREVIGDFE